MPPLDVETAKVRVGDEVQRRAELLLHTSHYIHAHPELLFAEHLASEHLTSVLAREGLDVTPGAYGLDTAFSATAGTKGPTVAVLCEYDALPGLGHACGHNIIAAAGLGAALAAASVADDAGGRVVVLGTPAEEGGGGKIVMAEKGAFEGVEAALMVHPAGVELTHTDSLAIATWEVQYHGQAAHASAAPDHGRNALDAAVLGYNAVAALRQHLARTDRVHGVFRKAGDKPNIVPDHTVAEWYVRSATAASLESVKSRVLACLEAGAAAAGCRMEWRTTAPEYSELRHNRPLIELYRDNSNRVGRQPEDPLPEKAPVLSTDMGNVSHLVPSIHPLVKVSPEDISIHSAEFVDWAASPDGDRAVLDAATTLAMTVVDLWLRADARAEVRAAFDTAPNLPAVHPYVVEEFSAEEADVLGRYFTNVEGPVFALVNLPEVVKGALFARYSRTHKSLRRLFLDEFVDELDTSGDVAFDATVGLRRAEELYERVFFEYGDDSVAQLGGVHLACEQASNLLTKVLEWGRLMAYLEQSTRYLTYDDRLGGRYRYHRDPAVLGSSLGTRYVGDLDSLFSTYAQAVPVLSDWYRRRHAQQPADSELVYRRAIRAKAFDTLRGLLPAAALSNVGIYGTGQAYELMVLRMRSHPLPEARSYAEVVLTELRKVIPSFLTRVDRPDRGREWTAYLESTARSTATVAAELIGDEQPEPRPPVALVDFDPEAEDKLLAAMLYPYVDLPDDQLLVRVRTLSADDRHRLVAAYVGDRRNRRHKPGRGLERVGYRFDVISDYGAFRDLQRHRMLTIQWQSLTPGHGYELPDDVAEAGVAEPFEHAMARSAALHDALEPTFPAQAAYAVALAFRLRYSIELNAREAMHMLELRTAPAGHAAYRRICQEMHRLIRDKAGHHLVADMMSFVDYTSHDLERLGGERRTEARRGARAAP